jgi:hypothetical protein
VDRSHGDKRCLFVEDGADARTVDDHDLRALWRR